MNLEEIFESSNKPSENLKVADNGDDKARRVSDFVDIISGKKKFEGSIDTPQKMEQVVGRIEKLLSSDDKSDTTHSLKKGLSRLAKQIPDIRKILAKIKVKEKISPADEKKYDAFADAVESIFFNETYIKDLAPQGKDATSKPRMLLTFENSFPIMFERNGKKYYGLVRPPTGMITWSGNSARQAAKDANIPLKMQLVGKDYKINQSKMMDNLKKEVGLKFVDNADIRKRVNELVQKHGADFNKDGYPQWEKGLEKVGFWKDLEEIL